MTDQQWQLLQLSTETMCIAEDIIIWRELPRPADQPETEYGTFTVPDYVEARVTVEDQFRQSPTILDVCRVFRPGSIQTNED